MNLKGVILEDGRGREFVLVCERSHMRFEKTFALRGWQRRRLVPLHYTERELRKIVGGVLDALDDLFRSLPRLHEHIDGMPSDGANFATPLRRKTLMLRKVARLEEEAVKGGKS
ncbi:MAG: hypothetical protein A4E19_11800 [Nitrospira sp. SG-bin1]|nr:MAG: hypothetical protein A4E19_09860 [Nitrospira sp. SG-bin1]OQW38061.1 MAG: hypothetical protein A4E19_11800 [Nitrospira sp. SG-bin1]